MIYGYFVPDKKAAILHQHEDLLIRVKAGFLRYRHNSTNASSGAGRIDKVAYLKHQDHEQRH